MQEHINQLHYLFQNEKLLVFTKGRIWFDQQLLEAYSHWVETDQSYQDLMKAHPESVDDVISLKNIELWALLHGYRENL